VVGDVRFRRIANEPRRNIRGPAAAESCFLEGIDGTI